MKNILFFRYKFWKQIGSEVLAFVSALTRASSDYKTRKKKLNEKCFILSIKIGTNWLRGSSP
jgi:hypothetical protein